MGVFFVAYEQEEFLMLTHFIAFCAGGFFGVAVMCMCFAAGEEDRRMGCYDEKGEKNK